MKKYIVFAAVLIALIAIPTIANATPTFEEATITSEGVNMRLRPDTDAPVVLKLTEGSRVGVFEEEVEGWYRVIYGNYRGYISTEFVFLPSVDSIVGNCLTDGTPVRQNPLEFSTVVTTVDAGEGVTITNMIGDWYYIETVDGEGGYVLTSEIKKSTATTVSDFLKEGMSGAAVTKLQKELRSRGFFAGSATGFFGSATVEAVKLFQKEAKLSADGVAGSKTLDLVYGDNSIMTSMAKRYGITNKVQLSTWTTIDKILGRYCYFKITDVKTGISFTVYRFGGWYHADVEPATLADTRKLDKIYNNLAHDDPARWNRRAVWVTYGGYTWAASIHGFPHMVDVVKGNDFAGHMCVHFYKSKVHETSKECPYHQACVLQAYAAAQ